MDITKRYFTASDCLDIIYLTKRQAKITGEKNEKLI